MEIDASGNTFSFKCEMPARSIISPLTLNAQAHCSFYCLDDVCVQFRQSAQTMFVTEHRHQAKIREFVCRPDGFETILRNSSLSMFGLEMKSGLHGISDMKYIFQYTSTAISNQILIADAYKNIKWNAILFY